jgi:hypothetical protein
LITSIRSTPRHARFASTAAAGRLRGDVGPEDGLSSIVGVFLTTGAPEQRAQARRMLDL